MDVRVGLWRKLSAEELMLLNCGVGEDSCESLGLEIQPVHPKGDQSWVFIGSTGCWSWNSNTLATSCEELTHWKRLWCWEVLGAGGKEDDRGWDGWRASPTRYTGVWVNSGSWWLTGRPGVLPFMGLQRVGHDWATGLNWIPFYAHCFCRELLRDVLFFSNLCSNLWSEKQASDLQFWVDWLSISIQAAYSISLLLHRGAGVGEMNLSFLNDYALCILDV